MQEENVHTKYGVLAITDRMSKQELSAMYFKAASGFPPTEELERELFTEDNGKKVHPYVMKILDGIIAERIV